MTADQERSGWRERLFRAVLIAGMLVCVASPAAKFLEWLMPGWNALPFLWFLFFASLEGILSEQVLARRRISGWAYLVSRLAEALLIALVLKFVNYLSLGLDQLWTDAATWIDHPAQFFTSIDALTILLFVPLWAESILVARQAAEMEADSLALSPPPDKTSPEYYLWVTQPSAMRDRQEQFNSLAENFVWGGLVLLAGSVVIHAFVTSVQALALPILLYFALGIALLSHAHYTLLNTGWRVQGIPVRSGTGRRWLGWVALFLIVVALLALLLPTRYAMGPLTAIIGLVFMLLQILGVIAGLLFYLLAWLLWLLVPGSEQPEPPAMPQQPLPTPVPAEMGGADATYPWLQVLGSALFWITILAILGYTLIRFVRDRFGMDDHEIQKGAGWRARLVAWLRALWRRFRGWGQEAQARLAHRLVQRRVAVELPGRRTGLRLLRGLSPRALVRYFYLSALHRAAQAGMARRPAQTPYEYRRVLDERFPDLEPDLEALTEAFVVARYSRQAVDRAEAEAVRPLWQRIKAALRRKRVTG
ncbi:MAG: DUF4129 domain-containing protein [Anaerolineae bacterium]|nr:DUF4129 domain-containing protein [Anaerolineae bacterium]